jgi:hypothetical protein
MSDLEAWQTRVVEEKAALDLKLAALNEFINGEKFATLTEISQAWRRSQRYYMFGYSEVLGQIIADFNTGENPHDEPH